MPSQGRIMHLKASTTLMIRKSTTMTTKTTIAPVAVAPTGLSHERLSMIQTTDMEIKVTTDAVAGRSTILTGGIQSDRITRKRMMMICGDCSLASLLSFASRHI